MKELFVVWRDLLGGGPRILLTPRLFLFFEQIGSTGCPGSWDLSLPLGTATLLLRAHLDPKRQLLQGLPRRPTDPILTPSPALTPAGLEAPLSLCSDPSFWGNTLCPGVWERDGLIHARPLVLTFFWSFSSLKKKRKGAQAGRKGERKGGRERGRKKLELWLKEFKWSFATFSSSLFPPNNKLPGSERKR